MKSSTMKVYNHLRKLNPAANNSALMHEAYGTVSVLKDRYKLDYLVDNWITFELSLFKIRQS